MADKNKVKAKAATSKARELEDDDSELEDDAEAEAPKKAKRESAEAGNNGKGDSTAVEMVIISAKVPAKLAKRLKIMAIEEGTSLTALLSKMIAKGLDAVEAGD